MKKYLSAILVFDVLLPALLLGLPGCILLWALISFQGFADSKTAEFSAHQDRVRLVEALNRELQPVQAKAPLLKTLLSNKDIESRIDHGILAALEKFCRTKSSGRCMTLSMAPHRSVRRSVTVTVCRSNFLLVGSRSPPPH